MPCNNINEENNRFGSLEVCAFAALALLYIGQNEENGNRCEKHISAL